MDGGARCVRADGASAARRLPQTHPFLPKELERLILLVQREVARRVRLQHSEAALQVGLLLVLQLLRRRLLLLPHQLLRAAARLRGGLCGDGVCVAARGVPRQGSEPALRSPLWHRAEAKVVLGEAAAAARPVSGVRQPKRAFIFPLLAGDFAPCPIGDC